MSRSFVALTATLIAATLVAVVGTSLYTTLLSRPSVIPPGAAQNTSISPNQGFCLPDDDLIKAHLGALAGDPFSASLLYWHYSFCEGRPEGEAWLLLAADLGHPRALYNASVHYHSRGEPEVSQALLLSAWVAASRSSSAPDRDIAALALADLCTFHGLSPSEVTSLATAPNPGVQRTRSARR